MDWRTRLNNLTVEATLTDWLLMVFTAALTVVGILQWHEMHTGGQDTHELALQARAQADAARALAEAAKAQAEVSAQTFRLAFRPDVEVQDLALVQRGSGSALVTFAVRNDGTAEADNVHLAADIYVGPRLVGHGTRDFQNIYPAEAIPGATNFDKPQSSGIFSGRDELKLLVQISYGSSSLRSPQCLEYIYDPSARKFSPAMNCSSRQ